MELAKPPRATKDLGEQRRSPALPIALYVLLTISAGLALYGQSTPHFSGTLGKVAPWVFLAFACGFAVYRIALVIARRYSPFKAFGQISVAALFFMLLLQHRPRVPENLLRHPDASVREAAATLCGYEDRGLCARYLQVLLEDPSMRVRVAAARALERRKVKSPP